MENILDIVNQSILLNTKILKLYARISRYIEWIRKNRTSRNIDVAINTMHRIVAEYGEAKFNQKILLSKMAENKQ